MSNYSVGITVDATIIVQVEADSEEQARERALEQADRPRVCHHCSHEIQIGDLMEAIEATEIQEE